MEVYRDPAHFKDLVFRVRPSRPCSSNLVIFQLKLYHRESQCFLDIQVHIRQFHQVFQEGGSKKSFSGMGLVDFGRRNFVKAKKNTSWFGFK